MKNPPILINKLIITERLSNQELITGKGKIYTFVNPVSYLTAMDYRYIFMELDGILADGSLLVLAMRLLYGKKIQRRSFDMTSLAPVFFEYANENRKTVSIIGSKQDELEKAIAILAERYPKVQWKSCRNGYFKDGELEEYAEKVAKEQPDYIIAGMGAVRQERFLLRCKKCGFEGIGFTCGGFIHQLARDKEIIYYPNWINKLNLRFVYRFCKEKHTRKRYLVAAFFFPIRFVYEKNVEVIRQILTQ